MTECTAAAVSVHIVTYNSGRCIGPCLESVIRQTHQPARIVIVDNASNDDTLAIVEKYQDSTVRVQRNERNVGFAKAQNQALADCDAQFALVLNPDVVLSDNYIAALVQAMMADDAVGSATGRLLLGDSPTCIDSTGIVITAARRAHDRGAGEPAAGWLPSAEVFAVSAAAAMYRMAAVRDALIDDMFFDEDFVMYKEDVDVGWRLRLLGWTARYVSEADALHDRGWRPGQRHTRSVAIRRYSYANRYLMMLKNDRWLTLLVDLPAVLLHEVLAAGYVLLREPHLLPSWMRIARSLPTMLGRRAQVRRRQRCASARVRRCFGL